MHQPIHFGNNLILIFIWNKKKTLLMLSHFYFHLQTGALLSLLCNWLLSIIYYILMQYCYQTVWYFENQIISGKSAWHSFTETEMLSCWRKFNHWLHDSWHILGSASDETLVNMINFLYRVSPKFPRYQVWYQVNSFWQILMPNTLHALRLTISVCNLLIPSVLIIQQGRALSL